MLTYGQLLVDDPERIGPVQAIGWTPNPDSP
jgi:hypothetical protein